MSTRDDRRLGERDGRLSVRLPRWLRGLAIEAAHSEGITLSRWIYGVVVRAIEEAMAVGSFVPAEGVRGRQIAEMQVSRWYVFTDGDVAEDMVYHLTIERSKVVE